ncbi:hypothetical protein [Gordonia paraffinivorans]|uniref:hypothetical protein n=1 Tax=Gordonia paraffinivorans TaxID=175628 RepID=UPI001B355368|nr:hypothetical protein [Gordonia paraffinivorans]
MFESPEARKPRPPAFAAAIEALAAYLRGVADGAAAERVTAERRRAYRRLFDTRVHLQRTLSEPPPAGAEAWSWIPLVTAAERIADRITGISALRRPVPGRIWSRPQTHSMTWSGKRRRRTRRRTG